MKTTFALIALAAAYGLMACGQPQSSDDHASAPSSSPTCDGKEGIAMADAGWTKPARAGQPVSAAYITLCNGTGKDEAVLSVSYDGAKAVEIHQSTMNDGMMQMKKLDRLVLSAGEKTQMAPGGTHLMLIGVTRPLVPDQQITMRFEFEQAAPAEFTFTVRKPVTDGEDQHNAHDGH